MLHPSTKRLIDKLNEMTRKQRVTWTEGENAAVVHDTEGYRVVLTPEPHAVLLTDALGREIETCQPEEFADDVDSLGRPYSKFIAELYREAYRHARGTEKAIRTLLAGLDAVESEAARAEAAPPVRLIEAPHAATDETLPSESETEITAAVATLADQINGPAAEAAPAPQAELAAPEPEPQPEPEPVAEVVAVSPAPEPEPEPEPEIAAAPVIVAEPEPETTVVIEAAIEAPEELAASDEPGSFGTFGEFVQEQPAAPVETALEVAAPEPQPEPVTVQAAPEPEHVPEPSPAPAPEPAPAPVVPTLTQPISLSSIPFGFGLGAAQRVGTPSHPSTSAAPAPAAEQAEAPKRIVIDGTLDLPDVSPSDYDDTVSAESYPPSTPVAGPMDLPGETAPAAPEPGNPRRFNPWN
ncbi:MAG: hypothetical protein IPK75_01035 [Acidobacteria bacterium]|jgi:hypothetical protein|nr:hypothetical protein [Acidobacteriota bacterium]